MPWAYTPPPLLQLVPPAGTNNLSSAGMMLVPSSCLKTPEEWRLKLLGLLVTFGALAQGAPFLLV